MFKLIKYIKNKLIIKRKINTILDCIVDINIQKDLITVKLNKDLMILSDQNIILGSHQNIVLKSKTLHLNPEIDIVKNIDESGVKKTINLIFDKIEENNEFIDVNIDVNQYKEICDCKKSGEDNND